MSALARATLAIGAVAVASCSSHSDTATLNHKPDYIKGAIVSTTYDGTTNDLLTAGLGKTGLQSAVPPAVVDPTNPTVEELRRLAIYNNYRALVDMTTNGGYGVLYGPNVDVNGVAGTGDGKIGGEEHIAYADDGTGRENVTLMVQIPATFSAASPCIVSAASSGSRGVYGAIGTAGEWGLKHGCAVAYTDKGTGNGAHDLASDMVNNMRGTRVSATAAGKDSQFTADLNPAALAAFNSAFPNRWAWKHAHSQQNPEKNWGRDTLRAIEFAFYMLNEKFGDRNGSAVAVKIKPENTIVIASSVSNGGGAAIAAAEQDSGGLIDGVAVGEPQVQVNLPASVVIQRGSKRVPNPGKSLYDYFTIANLYEPCAAVSDVNLSAPLIGSVNRAAATNRCQALVDNGLLSGVDLPAMSGNAIDRMLDSGWEADSIPFTPSHYLFAVLPVTMAYANAYSKSSVANNLCGYSYGAIPVGGVPPPISAAAAAQVFGTGNGVPPTAGVQIINNNSVGGAALDALSTSPSTGRTDYNYDGAKCLRDLVTAQTFVATTLAASIGETKRNGNLRGKPAIIVHGRADTLVPVNHSSRAYYALNKSVEADSKLFYYEITNAQHFDSFLAFPGYDTRLVPTHLYFIRAMDIMFANLRNGTAIPPSQVVRTTPRGGTPGAAPAITAANVPAIAASPSASNTITFSGNTLTVPE